MLIGLGLGMVGVTVNVAGVAQVDHAEHGLAWGLITTSARVGTALGLALLTTIATARTDALGGVAPATDTTLVAGFGAAFATAAAVAAVGGLAAWVLFCQPAVRSDRSNTPPSQRSG